LNLLWVCGLPGYSHLELIDVQFDGGYISISNADPLSRPRKLTYEESSALIVALNSLLLNVENQSREQIVNLIAKLVKISERVDPIVSIDVSTLAKLPEIHLIDKAIIENLQLSIDYYSPTTDSLTSRVIAPLEYIEDSAGKRYVYAWCYGAEDFRQFKLERIHAVRETNEKAAKFDLPSKSVQSQRNSIELELNEKALWFAEEWGIQNLERNLADQGFIGTVILHNHEWAIRAVLALGGDLRIPKDALLKQEIAARAAAALANYPS
jgi:proteasome accessory factor C